MLFSRHVVEWSLLDIEPMEGKEDFATPQYYYGDSVFKEVMQSVMDKTWIVREEVENSLIIRQNGRSWISA